MKYFYALIACIIICIIYLAIYVSLGYNHRYDHGGVWPSVILCITIIFTWKIIVKNRH